MQQHTSMAVSTVPIPFSSIEEAVSATKIRCNGIEYMVARCIPVKPPYVHPERGDKQLDTSHGFQGAGCSQDLEDRLREEEDFKPERGDKIFILLPEQLGFNY